MSECAYIYSMNMGVYVGGGKKGKEKELEEFNDKSCGRGI